MVAITRFHHYYRRGVKVACSYCHGNLPKMGALVLEDGETAYYNYSVLLMSQSVTLRFIKLNDGIKLRMTYQSTTPQILTLLIYNSP